MKASTIEKEPLIVVRSLKDPLSMEHGPESKHLWRVGARVGEFAPESIQETLRNGGEACCIVNGFPVWQDRWEKYAAEPGDDLTFFAYPESGFGKKPKFTKNKFLNQMFSLGSFWLWGGPFAFRSLLRGLRGPGSDSPTYGFDQIQTTIKNGTPIPVVYGKHVVGGQYINSFKTVDSKTGKVTLSALIALSEGPIAAIAGDNSDADDLTGDDIPDGIRIGGIEANQIDGVSVSWRLGYPDQDVIGGFNDTTVSFNVGQVVYYASPATYDSTTVAIDAFSVILTWPTGLIYIGKVAHLFKQTLRIRYQKLSAKNAPTVAANWIDKDFQVHGKTSNQFSREFRFDNLENGFYAIQVVRLTAYDDPSQSGFSTQFTFDTLNEITYGDSLSYPNVALLAIKGAAAENFQGGLPTINAEVLGKLVYVWTSGLVTAPTFSLLWSDSPAWCSLDAFTNVRYGGGKDTTLCDIDLQGQRDWADWCKELIDIGDGVSTLKERFTCNGVFDTSQGRLWDECQKIALSARASFVRSGTKIRVKVDKEADPVQLITMGNIVRDSFSLTVMPRDEKPNHIDVEYLNEDDKWNQDIQTAFDPNIANLYNAESIRMPCITRSYQAARQAQYLFNQAELIRKQCAFAMPVESIAFEPGDVVAVAHDMPFWGTASGRIYENAASSTTIKLDSTVAVPPTGTLQITVRTSGTGQEVFQTRTISSAPGTYVPGTSLTISVAWNTSDFPQKSDPWSAATSTMSGFAARLYRIGEIRRGSDLVSQISALEYNAAVYNDDPGFVPTVTGDPNPGAPVVPPEVTDLAATEIDQVQDDGTLIIQVNVSWVKPTSTAPYKNRVYIKLTSQPDIGYSLVGETDDNSYSIGQDYISLGDSYDIAVVSVSAEGVQYQNPDDAAFVSITITGSQAKPPDITGFVVAQVGNQLNFSWDSVAISNLTGYEIRTGALWEGGTVIAADITQTSYSTYSYIPNAPNQFWIKAKNTLGNYSLNATGVSITPVVVGTPAIDQEEAPTWAGTKIGCTVQPNGSLTMDGGTELTWADLTFTWDSPEALATQWDGGAASYETAVLDSGAVDDYLLQIGLSGLEYDSAMTWADLTMTWEEANFPWLGQLTNSNHVSRLIEISLSDDGVTYTPFQTFVAGQYTFRYLKVRVTSTTDDPDFLGIMTSLHTIATPV